MRILLLNLLLLIFSENGFGNSIREESREDKLNDTGGDVVAPFSATILINEFMASNNSTDIPGHSGSDDWIELRNTTSSAIDISGFYITDDFSNPTKVRLPTAAGSVVIPANGYLVLICSDNPSLGARHITLGLSASGEEIGLYAANGTTMIDTVSFGSQRADISMGRHPVNLTEWNYSSNPTPGLVNSTSGLYSDLLAAPVFSHQGGVFPSAFNLTITTDEPGAVIYYTLDGSDPDPANLGGKTFTYKNQRLGSFLTDKTFTYAYTSPISITDRSGQPNKVSVKSSSYINGGNNSYFPTTPVTKGTVVKAIAVKPGLLSEAAVNTYFVFEETEKYSFPLVSVSLNEEYLFDYNIGMYTGGVKATASTFCADGNYNVGWRYTGGFEYFEDNTRIINRFLDYRIHGGCTRSLPRKTLRVLGGGSFDYAFFKKYPNRFHRNLLLRNSGNNWDGNLFKDAASHEIVSGLNIGHQAINPSIVFLNGEYWGIHNMRERIDQHYLSTIYGVNKDSVDIIETYFGYSAGEGDKVKFNELMHFLNSRSFSSQANYDSLAKLIDIENFIDYQLAQIFIANADWPHNNVRLWRKRTESYDPSVKGYNDGRWRWIFFDADLSYSSNFNIFERLFNESAEYSVVFNKLFQNAQFRVDFATRFADILNTHFLPERTLGIINGYLSKFNVEIDEHRQRWNTPTVTEWANKTGDMINFFTERPSFQRTQLRNFFSMGSERAVTVDVSNDFKVNTVEILSSKTPGVAANPYPWTGTYFQNTPIRLEAIGHKGAKFLHWLRNGVQVSSSPVLTINLTASAIYSYKAVFEEQILSANPFPVAKVLDECGFKFTEWSASSAVGTHPDNMAFVYFNPITAGSEDHFFADTLGGFTTGLFNHTNRSRINGLGADGVSFINTGGPADHPGYPASRMGGLLLALNTTGQDSVYVSWTGGTILPNFRDYAIRLQYRQGDLLDFKDVLDSVGQPIEYNRNPEAGHSQVFENIKLPEEISNQPYVQLLWNYYFKGTVTSGARAQLRIDDIDVFSKASYSKETSQTGLVSQYGLIESKATVDPVEITEYKAAKHILLEPGFNTTNAAVFKAEIKECID
jgi:hypothetical protein